MMEDREREHWLSITDDPEWRRNHICDPNISLAETLAALEFPYVPQTILEIGCGFGRLTTEMARIRASRVRSTRSRVSSATSPTRKVALVSPWTPPM